MNTRESTCTSGLVSFAFKVDRILNEEAKSPLDYSPQADREYLEGILNCIPECLEEITKNAASSQETKMDDEGMAKVILLGKSTREISDLSNAQKLTFFRELQKIIIRSLADSPYLNGKTKPVDVMLAEADWMCVEEEYSPTSSHHAGLFNSRDKIPGQPVNSPSTPKFK